MRRREFLEGALGTGLLYASPVAKALSSGSERPSVEESAPTASGSAPMALGLLIKPSHGPEKTIARVKELGIPTCFLSLDDYIGKFNKSLAQELQDLLNKYGVSPTAAEVVGPGALKWNFIEGPSTIGIVPRATRAARIDALKQTSDFAKMLSIPCIQTHCGFIPENPGDPFTKRRLLRFVNWRNTAPGMANPF
jgi:sugar phosphate isomerase/epimerase